MDTHPLAALIAQLRNRPTLYRHWYGSATLGPLAARRLVRAVERSRRDGAVVALEPVRRTPLTRQYHVHAFGEGGHLLPLLTAVAELARA